MFAPIHKYSPGTGELKPEQLISQVNAHSLQPFTYAKLRQLKTANLIEPIGQAAGRGHAELYAESDVDRILGLLLLTNRTRLTLHQLVRLKSNPEQFLTDIQALADVLRNGEDTS